MSDTREHVARWFAHGEVGASSKTMALYLAFSERYKRAMAPADPADFDRCLRLLAAAPGLRKQLPRMAEVSDEWAALVARWDDIERSHLNEVGLGWTKARSAPRTYKLMRDILDGDGGAAD